MGLKGPSYYGATMKSKTTDEHVMSLSEIKEAIARHVVDHIDNSAGENGVTIRFNYRSDNDDPHHESPGIPRQVLHEAVVTVERDYNTEE